MRWYDSGCYKCLIDGKVACQSEVTVIASQQAETSIGAPTFLSRPEPRVVEVGDDIVLSCTSDGMPAPTVRWEKDGEGILIHLENNQRLFNPIGLMIWYDKGSILRVSTVRYSICFT